MSDDQFENTMEVLFPIRTVRCFKSIPSASERQVIFDQLYIPCESAKQWHDKMSINYGVDIVYTSLCNNVYSSIMSGENFVFRYFSGEIRSGLVCVIDTRLGTVCVVEEWAGGFEYFVGCMGAILMNMPDNIETVSVTYCKHRQSSTYHNISDLKCLWYSWWRVNILDDFHFVLMKKACPLSHWTMCINLGFISDNLNFSSNITRIHVEKVSITNTDDDDDVYSWLGYYDVNVDHWKLIFDPPVILPRWSCEDVYVMTKNSHYKPWCVCYDNKLGSENNLRWNKMMNFGTFDAVYVDSELKYQVCTGFTAPVGQSYLGGYRRNQAYPARMFISWIRAISHKSATKIQRAYRAYRNRKNALKILRPVIMHWACRPDGPLAKKVLRCLQEMHSAIC